MMSSTAAAPTLPVTAPAMTGVGVLPDPFPPPLPPPDDPDPEFPAEPEPAPVAPGPNAPVPLEPMRDELRMVDDPDNRVDVVR